jgi:hypothetical protein
MDDRMKPSGVGPRAAGGSDSGRADALAESTIVTTVNRRRQVVFSFVFMVGKISAADAFKNPR